MRNFAINLTTCSKKDRKEAIRLAKENGWKWRCDSRFKDCGANKWNYIYFKSEDEQFNYCHDTVLNSSLSLPNDWDKFKEYIGIKEPKKGEVWMYEYNDHPTCEFNEILGRFHKMDDDYTEKPRCYSFINRGGEFDINSAIGLYLFKRKRPATPEEISKLEKAERDNGYWWNEEELMELKEGDYVLIKKDADISVDGRSYRGKFVLIKGIEYTPPSKNNPDLKSYITQNGCFGSIWLQEIERKATKEEYEAQNNIDYKAKYYELKKRLEELIKE